MTPTPQTNATPRATVRWVRPAVDLRQTDDGALVAHLDVPGVKKESLQITVEDRTLTVLAPRSETFGYRWALALPDAFDPERTEARLADGVLEVTLRKAPRAEPRRIAVG